jgi:glycogen(starch) synthase
MKILFWTDGFWPRLGGIETQGFQFVKGLQERGHLCTVLAQKDQASWAGEETYRGIPIQRFDLNAIIEKRELGLIRSIQNYIEKTLREFQPDIIHLNACLSGSAFAFLLFQQMFQRPIVFTSHAPYLHEGQFPPLIEKVASSVDQICCVSNWVLQEMKKHLPHLTSKMRCIYNGLPMPEAELHPLSFSPPILLAFGRLSPEKGFDTAIRAFALLRKSGSNAQLLIAGGGPHRFSLEKLAAELELGPSIQFTGVLSEEEVIAAFNRATLVIVPSLIESFGLVILEAMQHSRPVIASRVEGVPEVVADGETGLLVPSQDPKALCQAIQTLLRDPERAVQMGMRGRERAMKFTIQQNVAQYEDVYRELAP